VCLFQAAKNLLSAADGAALPSPNQLRLVFGVPPFPFSSQRRVTVSWMGLNSAIEWTDATWNPTTGCDQVSPGCDHCYALTLAKRLQAMGNPRYQRDGNPRTSGPGFGLTIHRDKIREPYRWRKPRRVFVNSMSDLFHASVPTEFIQDVFDVMADLPQHQFQVLTKRPRRMVTVIRDWYESNGRDIVPNVWLGTSVEDQKWADKRIPLLCDAPARVRFLSCEPLLGPIRVSQMDSLGWVIVGGESGWQARPMEAEWVRSLRDQCRTAGVAFFFKQWGGRTPKAGGRTLEGRTWDEMPVPLISLAEASPQTVSSR
jgi:protein gp37